MPLVISDDGARLEMEIGGGTFLYTPCGWGEWVQVRKEKRDPKTLLIEEGAVEMELLKRHLHDWRSGAVQDPSGKDVPYSEKALLLLPAWAIDQAVTRIMEGVVEEADEQGNSESSSST